MEMEKIQRLARWFTGFLFVLMIAGDYLVWVYGFHFSAGTFKDFYLPSIRQSLMLYLLFYALIPFIVLAVHITAIYQSVKWGCRIARRAGKRIRFDSWQPYLVLSLLIVLLEMIFLLCAESFFEFLSDQVMQIILFFISHYLIIFIAIFFTPLFFTSVKQNINVKYLEFLIFPFSLFVILFFCLRGDNILVYLFMFILDILFFYIFIYFSLEYLKSQRRGSAKKGLPDDFGTVLVAALGICAFFLAQIDLDTWKKEFQNENKVFWDRITFNSYLNKGFLRKLHRTTEIETGGYKHDGGKTKQCLDPLNQEGKIVMDANVGYKLELGNERTLYFYPPLEKNETAPTDGDSRVLLCVYAVKRCIHECKVVTEELVEVGYLEIEKSQQRR